MESMQTQTCKVDQFSLRLENFTHCLKMVHSFSCVENTTNDEIIQTHAHAPERGRLQAASVKDAAANGIQCAVAVCVTKTERKRENELCFSQRDPALSYS